MSRINDIFGQASIVESVKNIWGRYLPPETLLLLQRIAILCLMKSPITVKLGSAIRRLRTKLGMTQDTLAERAALHRTYVSDVERGLRNISLESIKALADALQVSLHDLFTEIERSTNGPDQRSEDFERARLGDADAAKQSAEDHKERVRKLYLQIEDMEGALQSVKDYQLKSARRV